MIGGARPSAEGRPDRDREARTGRSRRWIPGLLFAGTLAVYARNVCPSLYWMDSGEFAFHATVLGIPHPTGYPLYIQIGKLLALLSGLGAPLALNLFSAVMAAATIALLYDVILQIEGDVVAAVAASLLFAFSFTFWSQAEIAEVYTLHTLFLLLITRMLLAYGRTDDRRFFLLLALVSGLGLTHHMSTGLMAPAILAFLAASGRLSVFRTRTFPAALALFALGLSVYLFIPLRAHLPAPFDYPKLHGVDPGSFRGFLWLVTGRIVEADMLQYPLSELGKPITFYLIKLTRDFVYIGLPLGIYGALCQFHRRRRIFAAVFLAFLAYVVFFVDYGVVDQHVFFIPSFLFWTIWVGAGIAALRSAAGSIALPRAVASLLRAGVVVGLAAAVCFSLASDIGRLDFRGRTEPASFAESVLDQVGPDALIVSIYEATPLLWYVHYIEGKRPDVEIFDRGLMSLNVRQEMLETLSPRAYAFDVRTGREYQRRLEARLLREIPERPCYLVRYDPFLNDRFRLEEVRRGLYRIRAKDVPATGPPPSDAMTFPRRSRFGERLDLFGVDLDSRELREGKIFHVGVFWSPVRPLKDEYRVLLRFVRDDAGGDDESGERSFLGIYTLGGGMIAHEDAIPGRVVADEFDGIVPPDTRGGVYRVSLAFVEEERFYSVPGEDLFPELKYLDLGTVLVREDPGVTHWWN